MLGHNPLHRHELGDGELKLLQEITQFPAAQRELLEKQYGITSAEAFFEHALRNASGVQKALKITSEQFDSLVRQIEGYLTPDFVKRCRQPVKKRSRGVITD